MPNVVDRLGGASSLLAFKAPCRLSTTAAITLSGYQAIDGVTPTSSEHVDLRRILVRHQTDAAQNGIYIMDTGTWVRAKDFDSVNDIRQGTRIYVFGGSTQSGTYVVTSSVDPSTFTIDEDDITIAEVGTFDQTTSALGMASGGVISFNSGDVTITHSANGLAFAGASSGYTFDAGVAVSSAVLAGSTVAVPFADVTNAKVQSNATDATVGFSAARFSNDTSPARLSFLKSRGASVGSHTVVQDGDTVGEIRASASDGTIFSQAGLIAFKVNGTPGSSDMPGRVLIQTSSDGSAVPGDRVNIDSTGTQVTGALSVSSGVSVSGALTASSAVTASGLITGSAGVSVNSTFTSSGNVHAVAGTTFTVGGVAGRAIFFGGSTTIGIYFGSSAPAIAAGRGSIYIRDDGGSSLTRAYIQSSGSTNTWVGLLTTA